MTTDAAAVAAAAAAAEAAKSADAANAADAAKAAEAAKAGEQITLSPAALAERLARQSRTAVAEYVASLGLEKPEDLKALVDGAKAQQEAAKTDLQKAQDAAKAAEDRATALGAQVKDGHRSRAIFEAAGKAGIPADRLGAAVRLIDVAAITVADDGKVTGAEEAVKALLDSSPWLKADAGAGGSRGAGADGGAGGRGSGATGLSEAETKAARDLGLDPARYAAAKAGTPQTEGHAAYVAELAAPTKK